MTPTATQLGPDDGRHYRVTLARVIRSELTKLRSLRSTWVMLGTAGILMIVIATVGGSLYASWVDAGKISPSRQIAMGAPFFTFDLVALIIGCLGVVSIVGEHSTGAIRATLTAVPRRLPVLWAKAIALVAMGGPVILAGNVVSFLGFQAFAGSHRAPLSDPTALRIIVGATAAAVGFGLLGLGIGAVLRSPVASIIVMVGLLLFAPVLFESLPPSALDAVADRLPTVAAREVITSKPVEPGKLVGGAATVVGWVIVGLFGGAVVLHRRDL